MNLTESFGIQSPSPSPSRGRRLRGAVLGAAALLFAGSVGGSALAARRGDSEVVAKANKAAAQPASEGVINVNKAAEKQLLWLPGIGPSKARRISAYRARHPFKRVINLARVKGIGLKTVRRLKRWLVVRGETTMSGPVGGKKTSKKAKKRDR